MASSEGKSYIQKLQNREASTIGQQRLPPGIQFPNGNVQFPNMNQQQSQGQNQNMNINQGNQVHNNQLPNQLGNHLNTHQNGMTNQQVSLAAQQQIAMIQEQARQVNMMQAQGLQTQQAQAAVQAQIAQAQAQAQAQAHAHAQALAQGQQGQGQMPNEQFQQNIAQNQFQLRQQLAQLQLNRNASGSVPLMANQPHVLARAQAQSQLLQANGALINGQLTDQMANSPAQTFSPRPPPVPLNQNGQKAPQAITAAKAAELRGRLHGMTEEHRELSFTKVSSDAGCR
jgi:hypothetical protein